MIPTASRIANVEEYYFSKKLQEVRELDSAEQRVINLGIGSPDLPPDPSIIDVLTRSAQDPSHHAYQSYRGIPAFRKAISAFYQRTYRVTLDAETTVLPLIGSKEGIMHVTMAFVNPGEEVLIPDPGYPTYGAVARLVGAVPKSYQLAEKKSWAIDLDALRKTDLSRIKLMWINYPHMPTGRVADESELGQLVELAAAHDFMIVNDNPYSLVLNDHPVSLLSIPGAWEHCMELNSLSKSHNMAGWRLGWIAGRKDYVDAVLRVKSNMDSGMFQPLQEAAATALSLGEDWFRKLNQTYGRRRELAWNILDTLNCSYDRDQSGLFVWARTPETVKDVVTWIDEILYGVKVFITPGFIFGETGRRYVRVSLCCKEADLAEAKSRLEMFVKASAGKKATQRFKQ